MIRLALVWVFCAASVASAATTFRIGHAVKNGGAEIGYFQSYYQGTKGGVGGYFDPVSGVKHDGSGYGYASAHYFQGVDVVFELTRPGFGSADTFQTVYIQFMSISGGSLGNVSISQINVADGKEYLVRVVSTEAPVIIEAVEVVEDPGTEDPTTGGGLSAEAELWLKLLCALGIGALAVVALRHGIRDGAAS